MRTRNSVHGDAEATQGLLSSRSRSTSLSGHSHDPDRGQEFELSDLHTERQAVNTVDANASAKAVAQVAIADPGAIEAQAAAAPLSEVPGQPIPAWRKVFSPGVQIFLMAMMFGMMMRAASKYVVDYIDPLVALQLRMITTAAVVLFSIVVRQIPYGFWGPEGSRGLLALRGGLGLMNTATMYYAFKYMSLPDMAVIGFLGPIVTGMMSRVLLHESYVWQQALCGLIALAGVVVIARPIWLFSPSEDDVTSGTPDGVTASQRSIATMAAVGVVFSASLIMIVIKKLSSRIHPLNIVAAHSTWTIVGTTLMVAGSTLWGSRPVYPDDAKTWGILCLTGILGFLLQYLSSRALQLEQASVLASFRPVQLIWAIIFEAAIWHDLPGMWSVIGGIIIFASVTYSATYKKDAPLKS